MESINVVKEISGYCSMTYDLNVMVLIHHQGRYRSRVEWFKILGLYNLHNLKLHVTVVSSQGDGKNAQAILTGWPPQVDVTFLEMGTVRARGKVHGYYLWLKASALHARWHLRVDDDSITDVGQMFDYVTQTYGDVPAHVMSSPFDYEHYPFYGPYFQDRARRPASLMHEWESSISSHAAMQAVFSDDEIMQIIEQTGQILPERSSVPGGDVPGDVVLALSMQMAGVPLFTNPFSDRNARFDRLTLHGGDLHHIHYVNWDDAALRARLYKVLGKEVGDRMSNEMLDSLPLTNDTALARAEQFIERIPAYPGTYQGCGIVICAGGTKYFANAWVCIRMLRHNGCTLPIQIWHLGRHEFDDHMQSLVAEYSVECVNAQDLCRFKPATILDASKVNTYALLHCPFNEILLLDADNVPIVDPTFLFHMPEYQAQGAILWPDVRRHTLDAAIWSLVGVTPRDEPEIGSGQVMLNKERCWRALNLAHWYSNYSDFFGQHQLGDKKTFHFAFRKLDQSYAMPVYMPKCPVGATYQHDFQGRRIFQHRNARKWNLNGTNENVAGFLYEQECLNYLHELESRWDAEVVWSPHFAKNSISEAVRAAAEHLTKGMYSYHRVGHDRRIMEFLPNGLVGRGHAGAEVYWDVEEEGNQIYLSLFSGSEVTCRLQKDEDGTWRGEWERYEQMSIEVSPAINVDPTQSYPYKLFTFADPNWQALKRQFLSTLKDSYIVTVFEFNPINGTLKCGDTEIWNYKLRKIIECIEQNQGEVILFTDIDMQFFGPTLPFVQNAIAYHDIAVQFEQRIGINIGFLVIACSPRTLEFFQEVQKRLLTSDEWEQTIVSKMFQAGQLKWAYLDRRIWAHHVDDPFPPAGVVVHHATGAHGAKDKLLQLDRVAGEVCRSRGRCTL